ncbi:MAG: exosortase/archaeosortase family protein [Gemmatimonadota bacterium]
MAGGDEATIAATPRTAHGRGALMPSWGPVAAVTAAYLLLFGSTLRALLVDDWLHNGEYGHGLLLLPVAAYLAWTHHTRRADPEPARGLLLLAVAVLLFWVSSMAAEFFTVRVSALLALSGLTVFYRGRSQLRAWWLPFALMVFTIPLPEVVLGSLTLPLQLLASRIAVAMLDFRHIPVGLAGNIIILPGHELFVAEACSGLRSLSALFGMSLLIAGTSLHRSWSRIALLAVAIPAALAANALRVFVTGYLVYYFGPDAAEGMAHASAGIIVFLVALGGVALAMLGLRKLERRPSRGAGATVLGGEAA